MLNTGRKPKKEEEKKYEARIRSLDELGGKKSRW